MSSRGRSGFGALLVSFAAFAGVPACDGDEAGGEDADDGDDAGTGGALVAGATATGGGAGRGGASSSGGTSGSGLTTGRGGTNDAAGAAGKGGGTATGGSNAGRSGSMNGGAGEPPGGGNGNSPYEIECHGDTAMCGNPTALLCLGLRVGTEVLGYSCANECQSEADCSDRPASTGAAPGCVDFVNKKYCLLVCKNGDEQASCPTGMYCYVYEGTPTGYCLWR